MMPARRSGIAFFLLTLFFSSWFLDQGPNANTVSRAAMVAAVVEQGTLRIDTFATLTDDRAWIGGHFYSEKAPLPALLVIPFHWMLHHLGLIGASDGTHINLDLLRLGGLLCGSIPFALIITICWWRLCHLTTPSRALLLTWPTFFGSFLFVYSGSFYGHLIGAAFALGALIAMDRGHHLASGALIGAAVLCEYTIAILALCWALDLTVGWARKKTTVAPLVRFVSGSVPFAAALLLYNTVIFNGPLQMGYDHVDMYRPQDGNMVEGLRLEALWGLTLSPYRGLLPYMPVLGIALAAWLLASERKLGLRVAVPTLLTILFAASVGMWWGGWAFGPRHLTVVAVLLAYRTLPWLVRVRWARWPYLALSIIGLAHAFLAKATVGYSLPTEVHDPFRGVILPAFLRLELNPWQWPVLLGLPVPLSTALFMIGCVTVLTWATIRTIHPANAPVPLS